MFVLSRKHILMMSENGALRRKVRPKRKRVREGWKIAY